ncbi:MAG: hypothetical protein H7X94_15005 [Vallitaleaceae bacterium]|nr:hypothetical protein [Vallitaleaceae bacterium]
MNEVLVKKIIKYKLDRANALMDLLPAKVSEEVKSFGKVLLETMNENFSEEARNQTKPDKSPEGLHNVTIE